MTHIEDEQREAVVERAVAFVSAHFKFLNEESLDAAREQLFFPESLARAPIDVYITTMASLRPFKVVSLDFTKFQDPRETPQGTMATISIRAVVDCSLGRRSSDILVWWFPDTDDCKISTKPTEWVLEARRELPPRKFPGREFQFWEYRASRGELLVRSPRDATVARNIDLMFFDVLYVDLPRFLPDLEWVEPTSDDLLRSEERLGKPIEPPDSRVFVLKCQGRRHIVVAAKLYTSENDMGIYDSPFQ